MKNRQVTSKGKAENMITSVWIGWGEGADCYRTGQGNVSEITESEYRICGDPYPCFLVKYKDGSTLEIRQVKSCCVKRDEKAPHF